MRNLSGMPRFLFGSKSAAILNGGVNSPSLLGVSSFVLLVEMTWVSQNITNDRFFVKLD